jgi:hypothetical protein
MESLSQCANPDVSTMRLTAAEVSRFWLKVNKDGPLHPVLQSQCWIWAGSKGRYGHGSVRLRGRTYKAHRISWLIEYGRWPDHLACHHCDVPACVHPLHLFDGTHGDNRRDASRKGRLVLGDRHHMRRLPRQGEAHPSAKATMEQVRAIRAAQHPYVLGRELGLSKWIVKSVRAGKSWRYE